MVVGSSSAIIYIAILVVRSRIALSIGRMPVLSRRHKCRYTSRPSQECKLYYYLIYILTLKWRHLHLSKSLYMFVFLCGHKGPHYVQKATKCYLHYYKLHS